MAEADRVMEMRHKRPGPESRSLSPAEDLTSEQPRRFVFLLFLCVSFLVYVKLLFINIFFIYVLVLPTLFVMAKSQAMTLLNSAKQ